MLRKRGAHEPGRDPLSRLRKKLLLRPSSAGPPRQLFGTGDLKAGFRSLGGIRGSGENDTKALWDKRAEFFRSLLEEFVKSLGARDENARL
jgi:hypothetical protein